MLPVSCCLRRRPSRNELRWWATALSLGRAQSDVPVGVFSWMSSSKYSQDQSHSQCMYEKKKRFFRSMLKGFLLVKHFCDFLSVYIFSSEFAPFCKGVKAFFAHQVFLSCLTTGPYALVNIQRST